MPAFFWRLETSLKEGRSVGAIQYWIRDRFERNLATGQFASYKC